MDANANFSPGWFGGGHFADLENLSGWSILLVPGGSHVVWSPVALDSSSILQCLGAAAIMQWNRLPTEIQRRLFQHAVSMSESGIASQLRGEIARFLHNHKEDAA